MTCKGRVSFQIAKGNSKEQNLSEGQNMSINSRSDIHEIDLKVSINYS